MRIQESHEQDEQEYYDLHETGYPYFSNRYGPGIHKNKLYIENKEDQCIQIITDMELDPGSARGWDTALIGLPLLPIFGPLYKNPGDSDPPCCKSNSGNEKND